MRGLRFLVSVVTIAVLVTAPAPATAQAPLGDSAAGTGAARDPLDPFDPFLRISFRFDAASGPSGENPTGTATATDSLNFAFGGRVTCLRVSGNRAVIGVENDFLPHFPVAATTLVVVDGGPPGSGLDTIDLFFGDRVPTPATCSPPSSAPPDPRRVVADGDITVRDAPSLPTAKDQCKNGGWQTFGVFKNQGDCVSFVATGGKNPPAAGA